jgi:DNA-binding FadR family transcriptional regulator
LLRVQDAGLHLFPENHMVNQNNASDFIDYLSASATNGDSESDRLPSLSAISRELGVSVARLREQLEVAKALGLVEVRPRTGIRRLPYSFAPAVWHSLSYALRIDPSLFQPYAMLRRQVELSFWHQAVQLLTPEDQQQLLSLVEQACAKLNGTPIRIPHEEHRQFHLAIYKRLENPFVLGIIESYWDAYEMEGLNLYADYNYLQEVWQYHRRMVEAVIAGDFDAGYQALREHTDLLHHRPGGIPSPEKE